MRAEVTHGHTAGKGSQEGGHGVPRVASADSPSISRGHYYSFHLAGKEIILLRSDNTPRFNHARSFFSHLRLASDYD